MCCLTQLKRWRVTLHMWFDSGAHQVPSGSACPPSLSLPHLQGWFWYQIPYNCKKHQAFILWGIRPAEKSSPLFFFFWQQTRPNRASLVAQMVKNLPAKQETWVWSLGWEDSWRKGLATHSSTLAWRIPWTEEPGGLQSMGSHRLDMTEWLSKHTQRSNIIASY